MAVYVSDIEKIRKKIVKSQAAMQKAVAHAQQRISETKKAKPGTPAHDERQANLETLRDAKRVLKALDLSFAELRYACCENDLSCNPEVLGLAYRPGIARKNG